MFERWKKAVVHLECSADNMSHSEYEKNLKDLEDQYRTKQINAELFEEKFLELRSRNMGYHGTALFITHENRRYLLTARHVIWNEHGAKQFLADQAEHNQNLETWQEISNNMIYGVIIRVPNLDEVLKGQNSEEFLMNLGAGHPSATPYTFSDPSIDLALISLDQRDSRFADHLISRGFVPIPSTDIADAPDSEGQELLAIGFPSSTALVAQTNTHSTLECWSSRNVSLPISSFGRVAMLHHALPYFWADISIYPGNSGGPVIANNKLVGIVSSQAAVEIDNLPNIRTRIPFGNMIKTSYVHELIKTQIEKDRHSQR